MTTGGPTFTDAFDRGDSDSLGNGWSSVRGTLMTRSGLATNLPVYGMHTAVHDDLTGATQTVTADFASTGHNLGPRFALLLRYQDPQNYYMCYRQAGASSSLRIARVVNGVEKLLKSVIVKNPTTFQSFTLECTVAADPASSAAILTLTLKGSSAVTAVDSTFASGSVGFGMGYAPRSGSALSQQASFFSAVVN